MQLYVIQRRNGFRDAADLQAAAARSSTEGDKDGSGVRWIRSYVVQEEGGELGTFCIYGGESADAIRARAAASGCPPMRSCPCSTVVVRPTRSRRRREPSRGPE
jgi:hypothetical protein